MKRSAVFATLVVSVAAGVGTSSCKSSERPTSQSGAAAASARPAASARVAQPAASAAPATKPRDNSVPVAQGTGLDPKKLLTALNASGQPPYAGPTGTIRGTIRAAGDAAPLLEDVLAKMPPECKAGREMYARLFREGAGRTLADVLVAVTEYQGYVPQTKDVEVVVSKDCSWGTRTIALTLGQRIDVQNKGPRAVIPNLVGAKLPARIVAIPGGDPVPLGPQQAGRYLLTDESKPFMQADVFVLNYATTDVTGVDGKYEITGVPVGEVKVNAVLPVTGVTAEKTVKVEAGRVHDVDLTLEFDAQRHAERAAGAVQKGAAVAPAGAAAGGTATPGPAAPGGSGPSAVPSAP